MRVPGTRLVIAAGTVAIALVAIAAPASASQAPTRGPAPATVSTLYAKYSGIWYSPATGSQFDFHATATKTMKAGEAQFRWGGEPPCTNASCPDWVDIQFTATGHTAIRINGKVVKTNSTLFKAGDKIFLKGRPANKFVTMITTVSDSAPLCRSLTDTRCQGPPADRWRA